MIDFLLSRYWFEIERMFPLHVRLSLAERVKLDGKPEMREWFKNFENAFNRHVESRPSWFQSRNSLNPNLCDPISRKQSKAKKFTLDLGKFLAEYPPFLLPYDFSKATVTPETAKGDANTILNAIKECGGEWTLKSIVAISNRWENELTARVHVPVEIFRIENKTTGSYGDFYVEETNHAHILIFKVAPAHENKFWTARNDFKSCFEVLMTAGLEKLSAAILSNTEQYPLAANAREWRTDKVEIQGEKLSKLALFWRRIGFVPYAAMFKQHPESVIIVAPKYTLELKEQFYRDGLGNPYTLLSRSIYAPELEAQLKSVSKETK